MIAEFENRAASFGDILEVRPFRKFRIGVVTTGEEIRSGRIKDGFGEVLKKKAEELGSEVIGQVFAGDDKEEITKAIMEFIESGADMVEVTGGMSVDPDDMTPAAIRDCGGEIITYGAPVLPGAMFMLSYVKGKPVIGLPSCVMYSKRTVYDLVVPRIIAGERISREDIVNLAIGGQCEGCAECTYPNCGFI
jgi:molybdopterin biosynthesis enzyme